jgi:hypothetical protein
MARYAARLPDGTFVMSLRLASLVLAALLFGAALPHGSRAGEDIGK